MDPINEKEVVGLLELALEGSPKYAPGDYLRDPYRSDHIPSNSTVMTGSHSIVDDYMIGTDGEMRFLERKNIPLSSRVPKGYTFEI